MTPEWGVKVSSFYACVVILPRYTGKLAPGKFFIPGPSIDELTSEDWKGSHPAASCPSDSSSASGLSHASSPWMLPEVGTRMHADTEKAIPHKADSPIVWTLSCLNINWKELFRR